MRRGCHDCSRSVAPSEVSHRVTTRPGPRSSRTLTPPARRRRQPEHRHRRLGTHRLHRGKPAHCRSIQAILASPSLPHRYTNRRPSHSCKNLWCLMPHRFWAPPPKHQVLVISAFAWSRSLSVDLWLIKIFLQRDNLNAFQKNTLKKNRVATCLHVLCWVVASWHGEIADWYDFVVWSKTIVPWIAAVRRFCITS